MSFRRGDMLRIVWGKNGPRTQCMRAVLTVLILRCMTRPITSCSLPEIASMCGCKRTATRSARAQLVTDGWLIIKPRLGRTCTHMIRVPRMQP